MVEGREGIRFKNRPHILEDIHSCLFVCLFLVPYRLRMTKNYNQNCQPSHGKPVGKDLLFWQLLYFDFYRLQGHQNHPSLFHGLISIPYKVYLHRATQGHRNILVSFCSVLSGPLSINSSITHALAIGIQEWKAQRFQQVPEVWEKQQEASFCLLFLWYCRIR